MVPRLRRTAALQTNVRTTFAAIVFQGGMASVPSLIRFLMLTRREQKFPAPTAKGVPVRFEIWDGTECADRIHR